jgi:hypothetical protein
MNIDTRMIVVTATVAVIGIVAYMLVTPNGPGPMSPSPVSTAPVPAATTTAPAPAATPPTPATSPPPPAPPAP